MSVFRISNDKSGIKFSFFLSKVERLVFRKLLDQFFIRDYLREGSLLLLSLFFNDCAEFVVVKIEFLGKMLENESQTRPIIVLLAAVS